MRDALPELLREIADVTDVATALAIAEARGGQITTITSRPTEGCWLVRAVGMDKAKTISHHFTSGRARVKVFIPLGPVGTYKAEQRRRAEALVKAQQEGLSASAIARRVGITDRSVHRFRARIGDRNDKDQGKLF